MTQWTVRPGTFVTRYQGGIYVGNSETPFDMIELRDPASVDLLAAFSASRDQEEVISEFEPSDQPAARAIVELLSEHGSLTESSRQDPDGGSAKDPSSIRNPGFEIGRFLNVCPDIRDESFKAFHDKCKRYTLTSMPLLYSMFTATKYVVASNISGDIVECGVWRGGSLMMSALTLLSAGSRDRQLFLYDTFDASWEKPQETDRCVYCTEAYSVRPHVTDEGERAVVDDFAGAVSVDAVRQHLISTGYPEGKLVFVKGLVQETIPARLPDQIAILRLDTDFFESTYHELVYLYPRLVTGGVLIIDDYGKHSGATEATDRYFAEQGINMLLHRIDVQGRIGVKQTR